MLDRGGNDEIKEDMDRCKIRLNEIQKDCVLTDSIVNAIGNDLFMQQNLLNLSLSLSQHRSVHQASELQCLSQEIR